MKKLKILLMGLIIPALPFAVTGCAEDNTEGPEEVNYLLDVNSKDVVFALEESQKTVNVITENVFSWSVAYDSEEDSEWLTYVEEDDKITLMIDRLFLDSANEGLENEEKITEKTTRLIVSSDWGEEGVDPVEIKVTVKLTSEPTPPTIIITVDSEELVFDADKDFIRNVVVTVEFSEEPEGDWEPEWEPVVGMAYNSWIKAYKLSDNKIRIEVTEYFNTTKAREGMVSIVVFNSDKTDPAEINITQEKRIMIYRCNNAKQQLYYDYSTSTGTGYFVFQAENDGGSKGFFFKGFAPLADDPDNFELPLGTYTIDADGTGAEGTFRMGKRIDDDVNNMLKTNFDGTLAYSSMSFGYLNYTMGIRATGGTITVEDITPEGPGETQYRITTAVTGPELGSNNQSVDESIYIYEGPLDFENGDPGDTVYITETATYARGSYATTSYGVTYYFMFDGVEMHPSQGRALDGAYEMLVLNCKGKEWTSNDRTANKTPWEGTYQMTTTWNTDMGSGWILSGGNSYYREGVQSGTDPGATLNVIIDEGTMEITDTGTKDGDKPIYNATINVKGKHSISGTPYVMEFTYSGVFDPK